jgi:hypothetical protein
MPCAPFAAARAPTLQDAAPAGVRTVGFLSNPPSNRPVNC